MSKILIVDDDRTITELMKALMMMEGHEATILNDSTKTLDTVMSLQPDLITLDLMMPGLSGFELCQRLHEDSRFVHIPILIVSARDDGGSKQQVMQLGAADFLTKPFGVTSLLQKIKELTGSN